MFEKMKHMAKEVLPENDGGVMPSSMGGGAEAAEPMYPFDLSMTLGDEQLKKLGIDCDDEDCQVDNYLHLFVLAKLVGIHKTDAGTTLNLQVTHMDVEDESEEEDQFDEMNYGAA